MWATGLTPCITPVWWPLRWQDGKTPLDVAKGAARSFLQTALFTRVAQGLKDVSTPRAARTDDGQVVASNDARASIDADPDPASMWHDAVVSLRHTVSSLPTVLGDNRQERVEAMQRLQHVVDTCQALQQAHAAFDAWRDRVKAVKAAMSTWQQRVEYANDVVRQLAGAVGDQIATVVLAAAMQDRRAAVNDAVHRLQEALHAADEAAGIDSWCTHHPGAEPENATCRAARHMLKQVGCGVCCAALEVYWAARMPVLCLTACGRGGWSQLCEQSAEEDTVKALLTVWLIAD